MGFSIIGLLVSLDNIAGKSTEGFPGKPKARNEIFEN